MTAALVAAVAAPHTASAIPIHVHKTVPREVVVGHDPEGPIVLEKHRQITRVVHRAPTDGDLDGYADVNDDCPSEPYTGNGGCKPEPIVAAPVESVAPSTPAYSSVPSTSGGYAIPSYIVECESGGSYTAQNPSGAYGAYQIMPGTAAAYGCDLSTPAGQDSCAAEIYATEGASPWACG